MTGLYHCSHCALPPLAWRAGDGFCYSHAVAAGVRAAEADYMRAFEPETIALRESLRKPVQLMSAKEKLLAHMEKVTAALKAEGKWEAEPEGYRPDRFSEPKVEPAEMKQLNLPYRSLSGAPQDLPF